MSNWREVRSHLRMVLTWDLGFAVVAGLLVLWRAPVSVPNEFAKDIYALGASVLAIVFSVFFAALATIMSSESDEFLELLQAKGSLPRVIFAFRFTLLLLFAGLVVSVVLYALTSWWMIVEASTQTRWLPVGFVFLTVWGVSATLASALTSVTHSHLHMRFMQLPPEKRDEIKERLTRKPAGDTEAEPSQPSAEEDPGT